MVETYDLDLAASPVAERRRSPVGFALLGVRGDGRLDRRDGRRPRGAAARARAALMEAAIEEARARGVEELRLEVLEQNAPAVALYRRLGFEHERDLDVWSLAGGRRAARRAGAEPIDVDDAQRVDRGPIGRVASRGSGGRDARAPAPARAAAGWRSTCARGACAPATSTDTSTQRGPAGDGSRGMRSSTAPTSSGLGARAAACAG